MFTETPNRTSASVLSPSVTATPRMLSPNRASFIPVSAAQPVAARAQVATSACTWASEACPTTILRATPSRAAMYPNSRSPWAAWFRFMKSMSISAQGSSIPAWVCRCSSGVRSASSPVIHIFAGENVCIQVITPMHASSAFASSAARRIAAASVSTGFHTIRTGTSPESSSSRATSWDWAATWSRVSGP